MEGIDDRYVLSMIFATVCKKVGEEKKGARFGLHFAFGIWKGW
jgi:hypothetical protein